MQTKQIINPDVPSEKTKRNKNIYKDKTEKGLSYNALSRIYHISPQRCSDIVKKIEKKANK